MLSLCRSSSRSDIFHRKFRSVHSHSHVGIGAHVVGIRSHCRPLVRAMSELIEKQYTKLTQIDHVLVRYYSVGQIEIIKRLT